jgi:uncharacterized membrane protein
VASDEEKPTSTLQLKMFISGFLLMLLGLIIIIIAAFLRGNFTISGGAVIIVGPIPVILGAGPYSVLAVLSATILTIISLIVFFWLRRKSFSR